MICALHSKFTAETFWPDYTLGMEISDLVAVMERQNALLEIMVETLQSIDGRLAIIETEVDISKMELSSIASDMSTVAASAIGINSAVSDINFNVGMMGP